MINFNSFSVFFNTQVVNPLSLIFDDETNLYIAEQCDLIKRLRKIKINFLVKAIWNVMQYEQVLSIRSIKRQYNFEARKVGLDSVSYTAVSKFVRKPQFLDFCVKWSEMVKKIFNEQADFALSDAKKSVELMQNLVPGIQDLLLQDGTEIPLVDAANGFNGQELNSTKGAGLKLHATLSLSKMALVTSTITEGVSSERAAIDLTKLANCAFAADAGYPSTELFFELDKNNTKFLFKMKKSTNLKVCKVHAFKDGKYIGQSKTFDNPQKVKVAKDSNYKGQCSYDFVVEIDYTHDVKQDDGSVKKVKETKHFRLLKVYNPFYDGVFTSRLENEDLAAEEGYCYIITNIEASEADLEQIYYFYRLRWQCELYFKQLKSGNSLHMGKILTESTLKGLVHLSLGNSNLKLGSASKIAGNAKGDLSPFKVNILGIVPLTELVDKVFSNAFDKANDRYDPYFERAIIETIKDLKKDKPSLYNAILGKGVSCTNLVLSRKPAKPGDLSFNNAA